MSTRALRTRRLAAVAAVLALTTAGCRAPSAGGVDAYTIVVSAPLTASPWVGRFVERGARLAVEQINEAGGVEVPGSDDARRLELEVLDNGGSPQRAAEVAREAVELGAVAIVTDGVGAAAVAAVTDPVDLPVFVVFEGGEGFIDPEANPTLYRMAPADRPMSIRLADYLSEKSPRVALVTDDSGYGREGRAAMRAAFARNEVPVPADVVVPASAADLAPQVLQARRSGADTLVVWARAGVVAGVVRAARSTGWQAPVYTSPTGEDPLVRQQLADHPEWVDGLTFVSFRITSEVGPEPFAEYRAAFEERFGVEEVGVEEGGRPVVVPPDWSTYSWDSVRLVAAALARSGQGGARLRAELGQIVITGANGDERGFSETDREGVSPDDMYFGRFDGLRFAPVTDDPLSTNLPPVEQ